jgi:integrase
LRRRRLGRPRLYGLINPRIYKMPQCEEASRADRCVDYEAFTEIALQLYNRVVELRQQNSLTTLKIWSSYLALTLIILINGLRVREALRAARQFYETGDRRIEINAVKRGDKRLVIIPDFIQREDLEHIYKRLVKAGEDRVRKSFSVWLIEVFKVNPHSLRYSFIRYHTLTGKNTEQIAKALGLREKDNIKKYYLRGLPLD